MIRKTACALAAAVWTAVATAAPFRTETVYTNSFGKACVVITRGDEFKAVSETDEGYTCQLDGNRWAYSTKLADGSLVPGGEVGGTQPAEKHLRDTSAAYRAAVSRRYERFQAKTDAKWALRKAAFSARRSGAFSSPPTHQTTGVITGLTILVDFPVTNGAGQVVDTLWNKVHPAVTTNDVENLLNAESFSKYGNSSSVRKFFENTSNGKLSYRNEVIGPILLDHPREYYDDPTKASEDCVQPFINDIMAKIGSDAVSWPETLRKFRNASTKTQYGVLMVRGLNLLYAGQSPSKWTKGLWPHRWCIWWSTYGFNDASGTLVYLYDYQMSNISRSPTIGTFCHENGHMLCDFPDLYDYSDVTATEGVGSLSLMGAGNYMYPPTPVDPYLSYFAGWVTPSELQLSTTPRTVRLAHNLTDVLKITNPSNPKQYLLIQNRQRSGLDAGFAWSGVVVWRCDESGSNTYPQYIAKSRDPYMMNYECAVVQADGAYELERAKNRGGKTDCWYAGNTAAGYTGMFNDKSVPTARWMGTLKSGICLTGFSAPGEEMEFSYFYTNIVQQYQYTGQPVTPAVKVTYAGLTLKSPSDYVVSYSNNVEVGDAAAIVSGTNNFTGKIVLDFQIVDTPSAASTHSPLECSFGR